MTEGGASNEVPKVLPHEEGNGEKITPAYPSLFGVNYKDEALRTTPEAKKLEDVLQGVSLIKYYMIARAAKVPELSLCYEELRDVKKILEGIRQGAGMPDEKDEYHEAVARLTKNIPQPEEDESATHYITVPDYPTLEALSSPLLLRRLVHDMNTNLTVLMGSVQMALPNEKRDKKLSERFAKQVVTYYQTFPEKIDQKVKAFLNPFQRESYKSNTLRELFASEGRTKIETLAKTLGVSWGDIFHITEDEFLPENFSIEIASYLMTSIAEGSVSNFIKKMQAIRNKAEKEGVEPPLPQLTIHMGLERGQFVLNIDDNGYPFPAEDIQDPKGFIGKRDRKSHGYLRDTSVDTVGIGSATIAEILETYYSDVHASYRPAAVINPDGTQGIGARVQFRIDTRNSSTLSQS